MVDAKALVTFTRDLQAALRRHEQIGSAAIGDIGHDEHGTAIIELKKSKLAGLVRTLAEDHARNSPFHVEVSLKDVRNRPREVKRG